MIDMHTGRFNLKYIIKEYLSAEFDFKTKFRDRLN